MLVTRSSPGTAGVWWWTDGHLAGGVDRQHLLPGVPAQLLVVLLFQPGLADQVHAGEAGHRQVALRHLLRGDGLQVAEHLGGGGAVRLLVAGHRLDLRGDPGELAAGSP